MGGAARADTPPACNDTIARGCAAAQTRSARDRRHESTPQSPEPERFSPSEWSTADFALLDCSAQGGVVMWTGHLQRGSFAVGAVAALVTLTAPNHEAHA